jgi:hypothetical protein
MTRKTTLAIALVFASIAFAAVAAGATPISGTVTVENGTADGANVTVTPMTQGFQQAAKPVRTQVDGNQFSVDAPDAPLYLVQVVHGGSVHYEVLRNETSASMTLNQSLSGTVVNASGEPRTDAAVELVSASGYSVDRTKVDSNGTFSFGPLKPNATYRVQVTVDGVPYVRTLTTPGAGATNGTDSITVETPPPTDDESVLNVSGGNPASHVVQVLAPQNASQSPSAVETLTLRNEGDKPFVGSVELVAPKGAQPYAAMFQGRQTDYQKTPRGISLNVTVPANSTARVGVAWDLQGRTLEKQFGRDADSVAVVFRGYQPENVTHSENLKAGDAPIPLLTNTEPIAANDTIRLDLPAVTGSASASGNGSGTSAQASAESNSMPEFPALALFGGLIATVAGGFVAYRVL